MKYYCTHVLLLGSDTYHTYILVTPEADAEANVLTRVHTTLFLFPLKCIRKQRDDLTFQSTRVPR